jgi:hypothetical protein
MCCNASAGSMYLPHDCFFIPRFEGMCKRHWRAVNFPESSQASKVALEEEAGRNVEPPPPEGQSVYETILPSSIAYRPTASVKPTPPPTAKIEGEKSPGTAAAGRSTPPNKDPVGVMPLVAYLREGALTQKAGWHRQAERRARGLHPISSLSVQLEGWERQLAMVEILLLSGGTPQANFKDLAHAWGREKGFHHTLASSVCERRGEVGRKRRSDMGKIMSDEQRESFRQKIKKTRSSRSSDEKESGTEIATDTPDVEDDDVVLGGDEEDGVTLSLNGDAQNDDTAAQVAMKEEELHNSATEHLML